MTEADLQKSIDDLSAAIDRKNALVDELVAVCKAAQDYMGHGNSCNLRYYNCEQKCTCGFLDAKRALRDVIAKANRGVRT